MVQMLFRYGLELLQLHLGMYACFDDRVRYPWRQAAGGGVCALLFLLFSGSDFPVEVTAYLVALPVAFWCSRERSKKQIGRLLLLFVLLAGLEEMIDGPRTFYQVMQGLEVEESVPQALFNWALRCVILILIWAVRKKMPQRMYDAVFHYIRKNLLWMLAVVMWHIVLTTGLSGYAVQYIPGERAKLACFVVDFLGFFNILLLAAFVLYTWEIYRRFMAEQEKKEAYHLAEKRHYEMLLKRENATRKYRHDMKNHLICMEHLAREKSWDELQTYLLGMVERMEEIPRQYETGNQILDILTNSMLVELGEGVSVRVCGRVSRTGTIRQEDLCAVYGNLLQNAVEELRRGEEGGQLTVRLSETENDLKIEIENTIFVPNEELVTKKEDKELHGYGMINVREAVERNNGKLQVETRGENFYARVMLPW